MQFGVFIHRQQCLVSSISPQPKPSFRLSRTAVAQAERFSPEQFAEMPGVQGVTLTFDDFAIGMEQFGTRISPQMRYRDGLKLVA